MEGHSGAGFLAESSCKDIIFMLKLRVSLELAHYLY